MRLRDPITSLKARVPGALKRPVKDAYGAALSLSSRLSLSNYSPDRTILIVGSPRSGTTWLMNLVCNIRRAAPIFEPLKADEDRLLRRGIAEEWLDLDRSARADELRAYLDLVFSGRRLTRWSSNYASIPRLLTARRLVVKLIRATRSLGWLSRTWPEMKKLLLLRHPCAVVSSMLRSPGIWHDWTPDDVLDPMARRFPGEVDELRRRGPTREALLAAFWCADAVAGLADTAPEEAPVVTYEELVDGERARLEALYAHLDEALPEHWSRHLRRPSLTANPGSAVLSGKDPLTAWLARLDPAQVAGVMEVIETFGVDFYTPSPRPDLERLRRFRRLSPPG